MFLFAKFLNNLNMTTLERESGWPGGCSKIIIHDMFYVYVLQIINKIRGRVAPRDAKNFLHS